MKKPRRRLTVGLLMILVAISAVGLWAYDYARRIRVAFDNQSTSRVRDIIVTYAGQTLHLGPIEPGKSLERRIAVPPGVPVRVAFDVQGRPGDKERHIEAPGMVPSGPGSLIKVGWTGK